MESIKVEKFKPLDRRIENIRYVWKEAALDPAKYQPDVMYKVTMTLPFKLDHSRAYGYLLYIGDHQIPQYYEQDNNISFYVYNPLDIESYADADVYIVPEPSGMTAPKFSICKFPRVDPCQLKLVE